MVSALNYVASAMLSLQVLNRVALASGVVVELMIHDHGGENCIIKLSSVAIEQPSGCTDHHEN